MEFVEPLFALDVAADVAAIPGITPSASGSIVCTQPSPQMYLLTFASPPDNRLTKPFNAAFLLALDIIEILYPRGIVITTSAIPKFYSNGLHYENAVKDQTFFPNSLYPLWRRLVTYPMPTVALINGHAFAGGLMTAMMHDYRIMNPRRGFLCLNELDFGAPLTPPMATIFRVKLLSMSTFRNMTLESRRYAGSEALQEGIIDGTGGLEECLVFLESRKLLQKGQSPSYGRIKEELYREVIGDLEANTENGGVRKDAKTRTRERDTRRRVEEWERSTKRDRSKL